MQTYMSVALSYSDTRIFKLEDGLKFLDAMGRSLGSVDYEGKPVDKPTSYRIELLTQQDLEDRKVAKLLGLTG